MSANRGPKVWLDLDQAALDDAYNQIVYAPNRDQVLGRFATNSEIVRRHLGAPQRFAYGPTPVEGLDVYKARKPGAPINVFIHGGAWRGGEAKNYAFPAEVSVNAGINYVALDFVNVIQSGGDLMPMAEQVRRAIAWVYRNADKFGGDRERMYVTSQSSGAHLGGVAITTDWERDFEVPADIVKGALLASGMYDLKPVRLSARSAYVKFTDAMEEALSSQRHLHRINCPVVVAYGTLETPEFQRQARDFAAALRDAGKKVELLVGEGYNHFELTETLGNPYGVLGRAALELILR
ncbi:MAG TPA: alpha/beta hydrolase [Burkholderiales bacterium]|nr:alpha/beta hydrolase [Burkholderiales bacterium]